MKANMLSLHTPTTPGVGSKSHIFSSKSVHVAYQIKVEEVKTYIQGNTLNLHTPLTSGVGFKGHISKLCKCKNIYNIKLSTKTFLTGICYDLNNTEGELRAI